MKSEVTMETIVNLAKRRGFVFAGSEIYGGLANSWDYGPLGVALRNNIKAAWWKKFVTSRLDMVGIESALIMNPKVWEASGHVATFTDPLVECKVCHERFRADKEEEIKEHEAPHKDGKVEWPKPQ
ncbi:MAG: glycine--tRNA ligase, partial [Patescibacteria group bacterium]